MSMTTLLPLDPVIQMKSHPDFDLFERRAKEFCESDPGVSDAGAYAEQYLKFRCRTGEFAIPHESACKVLAYVQPQPWPVMPHHALGMIDVDGKVVCVIDLPALLGAPMDSATLNTYPFILVIGKGEDQLAVLTIEVAYFLYDGLVSKVSELSRVSEIIEGEIDTGIVLINPSGLFNQILVEQTERETM